MTNDDTYIAPNPYAADIVKRRAAESTPESRFAARWAAERTRESKEMRAELDKEAR